MEKTKLQNVSQNIISMSYKKISTSSVANIIVKIKTVVRGVEDVAPYKSCFWIIRENEFIFSIKQKTRQRFDFS